MPAFKNLRRVVFRAVGTEGTGEVPRSIDKRRRILGLCMNKDFQHHPTVWQFFSERGAGLPDPSRFLLSIDFPSPLKWTT